MYVATFPALLCCTQFFLIYDYEIAQCLVNVGVFYYQLGNLAPKYRGSLRSIHLISIAKSSTIQKYGTDMILEPFMADLKKLEQVNQCIIII